MKKLFSKTGKKILDIHDKMYYNGFKKWGILNGK